MAFLFVLSMGLHVLPASDKCQTEKRKTINGDDLLWAMSTLGFDKYVEPLKMYLTKYREVNW
jgi:nuclear transcription Y subunit beta